jgi:PHD-like zinc-binding domain
MMAYKPIPIQTCRAPEIYYQGDRVMNLESEIRRTAKLTCAKCGLKGAALGCFYEPCPKSYHPHCAYQVHGCRWDKVCATMSVKFVIIKLLCLLLL